MTFFKGQPVTGFQGALPQSEIKAFSDGDQGQVAAEPPRRVFPNCAAAVNLARAAQDALELTAILAKTRTTLVPMVAWCVRNRRWSSWNQAEASEMGPDGNFQSARA